ncbi:hypothetical protein ScPMuIL_015541 [Solemya velum]
MSLISLLLLDDMKLSRFHLPSSVRMDDDEYKTESEVEADSDHDDQDAEQELGEWLGQLESLKMGLDCDGTGTVRRRNKTVVTPKMAMESFRFSFLNDENQDVNFDAILGELCELETQLSCTQSELSKACSGATLSPSLVKDENRDSGNDLVQSELDALASEITQSLGFHHQSTTLRDLDYYRGNYPGNYPGDLAVCSDVAFEIGETDSAFSDNASLPSSESFTSMVTVSSSADTASNYTADTLSTGSNSTVTAFSVQQGEEEQRARLQAEKIRIALEKIKEAKIKKLFVRAFANDGSSKSILVDEKMNIGQICAILADKNHVRLNADLAVIEHLPELCMERILEDHDSLVENMVMWTKDSKNKILFEEKTEKYDFFKSPEKYILIGTSSEKGASLDPKRRQDLIEEFYAGSGSQVPEVEGVLYLKSDGKKQWKKYFFVLRTSGLYYNPKGKISKSSKDLSCLIQFDFIDIYRGLGWKKKYHAPTDYCFALKHPQIQKKNSKFIRYLCAENKSSLMQWFTGIRIAKHGKQLFHNYRRLQDEISMWDSREIHSSVSDSYEENERIELNPGGNLQDSRLSMPDTSSSRHSIVTVKNSGMRNTSVDCDTMDDTISMEFTPVFERKSSLTSQGIDSPQRGPVKRVSFSNTHSIINADSCEELVQLRHRDSITSASTDSSEDSSSSGESRLSIGSGGSCSQRGGKLRAKLPVTTETTRQISEMFQLSHNTDPPPNDGGAIYERRSSITSPIHVERDRRKSAPALHTPTEKDPPSVIYDRKSVDMYRDQKTYSQSLNSPNEKECVQYTHRREGSDSSQEMWCQAAFDKDYSYELSHYRKGSEFRNVPQCGVISQTPIVQVEKIVHRKSHERQVSDSGRDYRVVSQSEHYAVPQASVTNAEKRLLHRRKGSDSGRDYRSTSQTNSSVQQSPSTHVEDKCQKVLHERKGSDGSHELRGMPVSQTIVPQIQPEGYSAESPYGKRNSDSVQIPQSPIMTTTPNTQKLSSPHGTLNQHPVMSASPLPPSSHQPITSALDSVPPFEQEVSFPPPPPGMLETSSIPPPPSQYQGPPGHSPASLVQRNSTPLSPLPLEPGPVSHPSPLESRPQSVQQQPRNSQQYSQGQMANFAGQGHVRKPSKSGSESSIESPSKAPVAIPNLVSPGPGTAPTSTPAVKPTKSIPPSMPFPENNVSPQGRIPRSPASSQPPASPVSQSATISMTCHPPKLPAMSPGRPPPPPVPQQGHVPVISAKKPTHVRRASGGPIVNGGNATPRHPSLSAEAEDTYAQTPLPFLAELSKRPHMQKGYPLIVAGKNPPATMPKPGEQARRGNAQPSLYNATNNHSVPAQSIHAGVSPNKPPVDAKRSLPPPPPKRSETTKLSTEQRTMDTQNKTNTVPKVHDPIYQTFEECDGIMDIHDLPPPPPELLEGFLAKEQSCIRKGKPPPPPPKRSKETQLSSQ